MPFELCVRHAGDDVAVVRIEPDAVDERIHVESARLLVEVNPVVEDVDADPRRDRLIEAGAPAEVLLQVEVLAEQIAVHR